MSRLTYKELGFIAQQSKHPIIIDSAVNLYCSSKSWEWANANYNILEPVVAELNDAQIRRIISAKETESADLPGAHSFSKFCRFVYENQKIPRPELVSLLNEQGADYLVRELESASDDIPF